MPAGSATVTSFTSGVASPVGSGFCGNFTSTPAPVGVSAWVDSGCTAMLGLKCSAPHPVVAGVSVKPLTHPGPGSSPGASGGPGDPFALRAPGACHESPYTVVFSSSPEHELGFVRNALGGLAPPS